MGYNIDKSVIMIEIGDCDLYEISERIVGQLKRHNMHVAFAESITGGLISKSITDIKGASEVFELGMVTYSNSVKEKILGVPSDIIDKFTAVSKQTAAQMALNALKISGADVAVAVTGYAGPGNFDGQPAGLSYAALADEKSNTVLMLSTGIENNRDRNRKITAFAALSLLEQYLKSNEE